MPKSLRQIPTVLAGGIATVANDLGDLVDSVVFIGGAVAPLLQTHPPFPLARPTKDVDAIAATADYGAFDRLSRRLQERGFRLDMNISGHAHRWIAPSGIPFDLVPAGEHLGASGNPWDTAAIQTADVGQLSSGQIIHYVSAPGFLGLKWAAFKDRGRHDPYNSHDLEDIIALIASRPTIVEEIIRTESPLKEFIQSSIIDFLAFDIADDAVSGALANVTDATLITEVRSRLKAIASIP